MSENRPPDGETSIANEPPLVTAGSFDPSQPVSEEQKLSGEVAYWRNLSEYYESKSIEQDQQLDAKDREIETLREEATHNPVSGLLNERGLQNCYTELKEKFPGVPLGLVAIDLASFKAVNDALGHHMGDELLRMVGAGLRRESDVEGIVANPHGDEYIVVVPLLSREESEVELTAEQRLEAVIRRLEAVAEELRAADPALADLGFGIAAGGIVIEDGMELKEALRLADGDLYFKKNARYEPSIVRNRETLITIYSLLAGLGISDRDLPKYNPYNLHH